MNGYGAPSSYRYRAPFSYSARLIIPESDFRDKLKHALSQPLPGSESRQSMAPEDRDIAPSEGRYPAAVLIALFYDEGNWCLPLIKRVEDGYAHSGQIGLPGGSIEAGETAVEAALREAEEEIGLDPRNISVIGQLSPLLIPVSGFMVYPVVSIIREKPVWKINRLEVNWLFTVTLEDICNPENAKCETRRFSQRERKVPFFLLKENKVWGATAMILSEFRAVIEAL
ncbi:CoA pyrophosphatase [bacterium]|nr:CoA pyrophosphatase [bacterium]